MAYTDDGSQKLVVENTQSTQGQTPLEKKDVAPELVKLLNASESEETTDVHKLETNLNRVDELFQLVKVDMAREATLDAKVLHQLSITGLRKGELLHTNMITFDPLEFVDKMANFISTNQESDNTDISAKDWEQFGKNVHSLTKRAPTFHFMFGSFPRTPPEPKERATRIKSDDDKSKKIIPQRMQEMGKNDQEVTTEEVERVLQILQVTYKKNGGKPINYFHFVIHPSSFSQSVQNIFHTSFLIKDGFAKLYLDENSLPVIEPQCVQKNEDDEATAESNAVVISITEQEWKNIIKAFKITKPGIPPISKSTEQL